MATFQACDDKIAQTNGSSGGPDPSTQEHFNELGHGVSPALILLANPANDRNPEFHRSAYPNLGLLTIASAAEREFVERDTYCSVLYYDGAILGEKKLERLIEATASNICVLGLSAFTYNYRNCIKLSRLLKRINPRALVIMGNDHFSALHSEILTRQAGIIDYGFRGNDIVEGVVRFLCDASEGTLEDQTPYPGIVRPRPFATTPLPEDPEEYLRLPQVDFTLLDSVEPHREAYRIEQRRAYSYVRAGGLEIGLVDIARGCLKFAGPRNPNGVPTNACEFCGIIPGTKVITRSTVARAWSIIQNACKQGFNYIFVTADELPWTFWPLLRDMAAHKPEWYLDLHRDDRPRLMCYSRADAFHHAFKSRIQLIMDELLVDHFIVGLDGLNEHSLQMMNKPVFVPSARNSPMIEDNFRACDEIHRRGAKLTSGLVLTHMGVTPFILEQNFRTLRDLLSQYRDTFVEIDFELLCPIPGSLAYDYFRIPARGAEAARRNGVSIRHDLLEIKSGKYQASDFIDPEEMIDDFIEVFCPEITRDLANRYILQTSELIDRNKIYYECGSL